MPVLFSGLASLVFSKDEVNLLEKHYLLTIQRLLRLHDKTPRCVVYFLAGNEIKGGEGFQGKGKERREGETGKEGGEGEKGKGR